MGGRRDGEERRGRRMQRAQQLPDLRDVGLAGQADHDVQLLQLDVDRVVVLDEEHLEGRGGGGEGGGGGEEEEEVEE